VVVMNVLMIHSHRLVVPKLLNNPALEIVVVCLEEGCEVLLPTFRPTVATMEEEQQQEEDERQRATLS
jgi:hypothetical protein